MVAGFTHRKTSKGLGIEISDENYGLSHFILRRVIIKVLALMQAGISSIAKGSQNDQHLDGYIEYYETCDLLRVETPSWIV